MGQLLWSLIAFVGTHLVMSHPLRAPLVGAMGEGGFRLLYTLVSFATFGWVYVAFGNAPRGIDWWPVGDTIWMIATVLMLLGSILFAGSLMGNPALPAPGAAAAAAQPARGVFAITRHPMMWGFAIWGVVHILVAPYAASVMLAAGMIILALVGAAGQDRKKDVLMGEAWRGWRSRTSYWPFAGQFSGRASWGVAWPGRTAFLLGTVLWLLATYLHPVLGGPFAGIWRWM